jgi:hypothetical protein
VQKARKDAIAKHNLALGAPHGLIELVEDDFNKGLMAHVKDLQTKAQVSEEQLEKTSAIAAHPATNSTACTAATCQAPSMQNRNHTKVVVQVWTNDLAKVI